METFEIWASECFLVGDPKNRNPYRDLGEFIRAQVKVAVLERLTPILNQAQKKSRTQKAGKETRFFHGRKKRAATSRPVDPAKVQAYAERYALNPNPNFAHYPDGDCTNFVSQCLFYGGMPQKKPKEIPNTDVYPSKTYWYSVGTGSRERVSGSWIRVDDFFPYMDDRFYGYVFDDFSEFKTKLRQGYIIVLGTRNIFGRRSWWHVVICTFENGQPRYCGHTNNRLNAPIENLTGDANTWCVFDTSRWQSM